ncbi:MAG TPA: hypothetical protein P5572_22285, partial [Phycisphaerae bacterium]|nr:hypothetical protein [Phycisphaerae bacterium]
IETDDTPLYSAVLSELAEAEIATGRASDAEPLCHELVAYCAKPFTKAPGVSGRAQRILAVSLLRQGKPAEAADLLAAALPAITEQYGADHWHTAFTQVLLNAAHDNPGAADQQQFMEAEAEKVKAQQDAIPIGQRAWVLAQVAACLR